MKELRKTALAVDDLGEALAEVPALKRVLIFDTCQSGGVTGLASRRNPFAFGRGVQRFSQAQGVYCLAAASARQSAEERRDLGHGLLTYALLAGAKATENGPLAGKTLKTSEEGIDVLDWFRYARTVMPKLSRAQRVELSGEDQPGFGLLRR